MEKKVELLSPAGSYEAFVGAVNAGADAVYLGGTQLSARAYARNFTQEEVCRAIRTAHLMGRRIYLTVNTLVKDTELAGLGAYLRPFYETGLDGVIVQDLGVLRYIGARFPDLALHASTQMNVTGCGGAALLRELGVKRIVPARELSLTEIRRMKEETGLEIECFIHGAMCYCYSGQCLFSSILGGRSGNRGRCAQPCRLPYQIRDQQTRVGDADYPLSLKDMCTVSLLPQLIEAGIDSFKIEGRMKKPEYAAGVTALYRKYIDLYLEKGADGYRVTPKDEDMLRSLYMRSEIQTGYYERHNGREMITLNKPSYTGSDPQLLAQIAARYLREPARDPVSMKVSLAAGEAACLQITSDPGQAATGEETLSVTVYGATVENAQKAPLQPHDIVRQMKKTGNAMLTVTSCEIEMAGEVFLPVRALNELRRTGVEAYEEQLIRRRGLPGRRECPPEPPAPAVEDPDGARADAWVGQESAVDLLVSTYEQLAVAVSFPVRRIYVDSDLYLTQHERVYAQLAATRGIQYALALPYVLRAQDEAYLRRLTESVKSDGRAIYGFLVRSLEGLAYARSFGDAYAVIPDAGFYLWNAESLRFWTGYGGEVTLPYELNRREDSALVSSAKRLGLDAVLIVYATIPLMVTANCIRKTAGRCRGRTAEDERALWLRDRYGTDFPVETNCLHCYNVIYNALPYSLHRQDGAAAQTGVRILRYDFVAETGADCEQILTGACMPEAYTTGHFKRGVE